MEKFIPAKKALGGNLSSEFDGAIAVTKDINQKFNHLGAVVFKDNSWAVYYTGKEAYAFGGAGQHKKIAKGQAGNLAQAKKEALASLAKMEKKYIKEDYSLLSSLLKD